VKNLSLERIIQALVSLGLTTVDAQVYVCLASKGPNKVTKLSEILNFSKTKIYSSLKKLQIKGLVTKDSATYSAVPFEDAIEILIKTKKNVTKGLQETKRSFSFF
jgi:sugar-specific transcriptional regulator TrmB